MTGAINRKILACFALFISVKAFSQKEVNDSTIVGIWFNTYSIQYGERVPGGTGLYRYEINKDHSYSFAIRKDSVYNVTLRGTWKIHPGKPGIKMKKVELTRIKPDGKKLDNDYRYLELYSDSIMMINKNFPSQIPGKIKWMYRRSK